jgi:hypothetical protein
VARVPVLAGGVLVLVTLISIAVGFAPQVVLDAVSP